MLCEVFFVDGALMMDLAGMPVCEALAYVEQHRAVFDVVQVKYNDEVSFYCVFCIFECLCLLRI